MAEPIPLEDIREALEGGTSLRATRFRPSDRAASRVSPLRASIGRMARNPEVIAALLMLAICVGTFVKIYLDTGRL